MRIELRVFTTAEGEMPTAVAYIVDDSIGLCVKVVEFSLPQDVAVTILRVRAHCTEIKEILNV